MTMARTFLVASLGGLVACSPGGGSDDGPGGGGAGGGGSAPVAVGAAQCAPADCMTIGGFSPPFSEPDDSNAVSAASHESRFPFSNPLRQFPQDDRCTRDADGRPLRCKPAAGSIALLNDGRLLYFNALEGTEDVEFSVFFEAGAAIMNDQTRVMRFADGSARWVRPGPVDAGANPEGYEHTLLLPEGTLDNAAFRTDNDGALFCAALEQLADGRIIAVGGTDYYNEPGISTPIVFGISELEGLRNARVFNPADNTWRKTGDMHHGRWYPSLVTLADGDLFVASGVTKLVKPVYPANPQTSGRNVVETETYDLGCGTWAENGAPAQRSLPLYPRLHLLPNGHVLYNGAGQAFNPFGQSYDQPLWNIVATYDPQARNWTDLAYAGAPWVLNPAGFAPPGSAADLQSLLGMAIGSGFRGSTFSIMLPLKPDAQGRYARAEFLTAGGVLGAVVLTNPGSHVSTDHSRIDTVTIGDNGTLDYQSRSTGPLNAARWYGTGVLLPTGTVMLFSGADRDEVQVPGGATPNRQSELFDPATESWRPMAVQHNPRTYHNTALLLPDGRVLVGGHAPINTAYAYQVNLPGMSPNDGRDPSFEIYSPPYAFMARPQITQAPSTVSHGQAFTVTSPQAASIDSVLLIRRSSITHLVDGDQRAVQLFFTRNGDNLQLRLPAQRAVLPPGPYMLFINQRSARGLVPSVSAPVMVLGADNDCAVP